MVQLTWRTAMLRTHGPKARCMCTPRMFFTWEFGPCWTELQGNGTLDASAFGERRDDTCRIVAVGATQDASEVRRRNL